MQAAPPLAAEAAGAAQQTGPEPAGGGNTKKDKEKLRKERQRQRKMDEAWEALRGAVELMEETAGVRGVGAVEEAMHAAAKHEARSEKLAALVAVARDLLEQARAAEAERARVAAEAAAAAAAVAAAERVRLEEEMTALTLSVQSDARRAQSGRLRLQQVQA
jgi:DNA helicase IV